MFVSLCMCVYACMSSCIHAGMLSGYMLIYNVFLTEEHFCFLQDLTASYLPQ